MSRLNQPDQTIVSQYDIDFFSMPYWDVSSPFSAVPSLVAYLESKGIRARQTDLGIEAFHFILRKYWRENLKPILSEVFYKNCVRKYKNNPYPTYRDFLQGVSFLNINKAEFPLDYVKSHYSDMDAVQCKVIDRLYDALLHRDVHRYDFNVGKSIDDAVMSVEWDTFTKVLCQDHIAERIGDMSDIVGISVTGSEQFLPGCFFSKMVRSINPQAKIILGGSCSDLFMESLYENKRDIFSYFDYVIIGEGETAIHELVSRLLEHRDVDVTSITNMAYIDKEGRAVYTKISLEDVEALPPPSYDGLPLDKYMSPKPVLPYQASRGCHYGHCAFCNHNEKYRHNYRTKSAAKVVGDLVSLSKKYHTGYIQFVDEAIRPDHLSAIVESMEKNVEYQDIRWFYYSRVSRQYTSELAQRARAQGCRMVMFGIESFNQRLLNFIKKGIAVETSEYCLKLFHENGIKTFAWLMGNLPSETVEEQREEIDSFRRNIEYIDAVALSLFSLEINTDMYKNLEKYNITKVDMKNRILFSSHNGQKEINKKKILSVVSDEYRPVLAEHYISTNRYYYFFH